MRFIRSHAGLSFLIALLIIGLQSCATKQPIRHQKRSAKIAKHSPRTTKGLSKRDRILNSANSYIGTKYLYGGGDSRGFDCSGLVRQVFFENKIDIRGNSTSLSKQGKGKDIKSAQLGDLVFFKKGDRVNHVALVAEINKN